MRHMDKKFRLIVSFLILGVVATALTGCSLTHIRSEEQALLENDPFEIKIMLPVHRAAILSQDSPVKKRIEELTNTQLHFTWIPNDSYMTGVNIKLAVKDLPQLILILEKSSNVLNEVKAGAFWEIGPYLKDYPNLSQANPDILWNTSINGKYYGVYRSRAYGRNGIIFRKDWLKKVGLSEPQTIDDLIRVLEYFTHNDPDGNGKNDTYGLVASKSSHTFQITLPWFGAPNKWGEDEKGRLIPDFMTEEYRAALNFWKKLYDEKLINQDFALLEPARMATMFQSGKAGMFFDVADEAGRCEERMLKMNPNLTEAVDVIGAVSGPKGLRSLPTSGYNGMFLFPKSSLKTKVELQRALQFLDDLCTEEGQRLLTNGIDDLTYTLKDGFAMPITPAPAGDIRGEIDQLSISIPEDRAYLPKQTPVRIKVRQVWQENIKTAVPNPAEPYISQTYIDKGTQLDSIIESARVKYIMGQIDAAGFDAAVELWKKNGGNTIIEEFNAMHDKYRKKKS